MKTIYTIFIIEPKEGNRLVSTNHHYSFIDTAEQEIEAWLKKAAREKTEPIQYVMLKTYYL